MFPSLQVDICTVQPVDLGQYLEYLARRLGCDCKCCCYGISVEMLKVVGDAHAVCRWLGKRKKTYSRHNAAQNLPLSRHKMQGHAYLTHPGSEDSETGQGHFHMPVLPPTTSVVLFCHTTWVLHTSSLQLKLGPWRPMPYTPACKVIRKDRSIHFDAYNVRNVDSPEVQPSQVLAAQKQLGQQDNYRARLVPDRLQASPTRDGSTMACTSGSRSKTMMQPGLCGGIRAGSPPSRAQSRSKRDAGSPVFLG